MSSRRELANAVRALSMDAVQKANSGHPVEPMGMADSAEEVEDFLTRLAERAKPLAEEQLTELNDFAAGLGAGADPAEAARVANVAAGCVVREIGTATVTPDQLRAALGDGAGS